MGYNKSLIEKGEAKEKRLERLKMGAPVVYRLPFFT